MVLLVAVYLSFSIPTIIAGFAVTRWPLRTTTYVYGLLVMILAVITTVAVARQKAGAAAVRR